MLHAERSHFEKTIWGERHRHREKWECEREVGGERKGRWRLREERRDRARKGKRGGQFASAALQGQREHR